jgi:hypothetical protein
MDNAGTKLLVLIVLAAGLAGAYWYFQGELSDQPDLQIMTPPEIVEEKPKEVGPVHPVPPSESSAPPERVLVPLPPLDDSDSYFLLALVDIFGPDIEQAMVNEALIDKFVTTIDNLPRSHMAEKIRPVRRAPERFLVDPVGDDGVFLMLPENFSRYDSLVTLLETADLDVVVATYRRFYPLLQESYLRLGYPDGYFNDRVVEVIDHLLETPEPDEDIYLIRPHVLYSFAEPKLESLSSGQKLLLRMGRDHTVTIKKILSELRALIV